MSGMAHDKPSDAVADESSEPVLQAEINAIPDKVRRTVCTSLLGIFTQLVPELVSENKLPAHTDVPAYCAQLALDLEAALYEHHGIKPKPKSKASVDVGPAYRNRFRSLSFNLKDVRNPELQARIMTRQLSSEQVCTLSPEEMLNPELQELANKVRQESIRESVLVEDTKPRLRKTHKGEEVVGDDREFQEAPEDHEEQPEEKKRRTSSVTQAQPQRPTTRENYDSGVDFEVGGEISEDEQSLYNSENEEEPEEIIASEQSDHVWTGSIRPASGPLEAFKVNSYELEQGSWAHFFTNTLSLVLNGTVGLQDAEAWLERAVQLAKVGVFVVVPESDACQPAFSAAWEHLKDTQKVAAVGTNALATYLVPCASGDALVPVLRLHEQANETLQEALNRHGVVFLIVCVERR